MQAILKKWKFLIFGGIALVILAYTADPIIEFILRAFDHKSQSSFQNNPHWQHFTNRESGYVIEFPSRPFENPYVLSNRNVVSYRQFASVLGSNQVFMVATLVTSLTNAYSDEQNQFLMDQIMKGALGEDGKLLARRDVKLGTNFGREVESLKADGYFYKMRYYPVEHGLQTLTVRVPFTDKSSTNISFFLDSFRLIAK